MEFRESWLRTPFMVLLVAAMNSGISLLRVVSNINRVSRISESFMDVESVRDFFVCYSM